MKYNLFSVIFIFFASFSLSLSMTLPPEDSVDFAKRVHRHLHEISSSKGSDQIGQALKDILSGEATDTDGNFPGNIERLNFVNQKKALYEHLRLHRHFGSSKSRGLKENPMIGKGKFNTNPKYPSFFRIEIDMEEVVLKRIINDLIELFLSSKIKIHPMQTGKRANRFVLSANIYNHGIENLSCMPCFYRKNPKITVGKLTSTVQMVVSVQKRFLGKENKENQTIMITLFPDKDESLAKQECFFHKKPILICTSIVVLLVAMLLFTTN